MRVLTIFPQFGPVHLYKDVGQIVIHFSKIKGYTSSILSYFSDSGKFDFVKFILLDKRFSSSFLSSLAFLISNFYKFDVLIIYHFQAKNIFLLLLFKYLHFFNGSKGVSYLKLDANHYFVGKKVNILYKFLANQIDFVSAESSMVLREQQIFSNIFQVPNGFSFECQMCEDKESLYGLKENIFLVVGRIGSREKNHEQLLRAFNIFCKSDSNWKLVFVGSVSPDYQEYFRNFNFTDSSIKDRIKFIGEVTDRNVLSQYYKRAKVFLSSSEYEGFSISMVEAISFGCYLVSSKLACVYDITSNLSYGCVFDFNDDVELVQQMILTTSDGHLTYNLFCNSIEFANANLSWEVIVGRLNSKFSKKLFL